MTERTYTIPLRRGWQKVPRWRRAKRAVSEIQTYLKKHTKSKEVRIDKWINELVWGKGAKNPPSKITIKVSFDKDKAIAELTELPGKAKRLKEAEKSLADKLKKKSLLKLAKDEKTKKVDEHRKKKEQEKAVLGEVDNKTPTKKQEMAANKQ
ncbi:MAG: 50S ribosomal protein L31e [DPANN group archaeon]|nr:50S ribosomal protein L31e [DPANN group archaeon]